MCSLLHSRGLGPPSVTVLARVANLVWVLVWGTLGDVELRDVKERLRVVAHACVGGIHSSVIQGGRHVELLGRLDLLVLGLVRLIQICRNSCLLLLVLVLKLVDPLLHAVQLELLQLLL